jgi:hypothetical protein
MSGVGSIPGLHSGNPVVFMDISIGGHNAGRIKMEVRCRQRAAAWQGNALLSHCASVFDGRSSSTIQCR